MERILSLPLQKPVRLKHSHGFVVVEVSNAVVEPAEGEGEDINDRARGPEYNDKAKKICVIRKRLAWSIWTECEKSAKNNIPQVFQLLGVLRYSGSTLSQGMAI